MGLSVRDLHAILTTAIEQGRGDMPLGWMRGGEDEAIYEVYHAGPADYLLPDGQIDGYMHIETSYDEMGQTLPEDDDED